MAILHVDAHDLFELGLAAAVEQGLEGLLVNQLVPVLFGLFFGMYFRCTHKNNSKYYQKNRDYKKYACFLISSFIFKMIMI